MGPHESPDLPRQLAAERAAAEYWRSVAEQRRTESARVQRRPIVRTAIFLDRQTGPLQRMARAQWARVVAWWHRTQLRAMALRTIPSLGQRRRALHRQTSLAELLPLATDRIVNVLIVDLARGEAVGDADLRARFRAAPTAEVGTTTTITLAEVNRLVERCRPDAICILSPHVAPVSPSWLQRLTHALSGEVGVVVPTFVHPERPGARTPHDLLTRSRGIVVENVADAPQPRSLAAGAPVDTTVSATHPVTASAGCVIVGGDAWRAVGGLKIADDADSAVIDLTLRIGASGASMVTLPDVLVTDWRPVRSVQSLDSEIAPSSNAWRNAIAHHGPTLRKLAARPATQGPEASSPCSITLTTSVPSAKLVRTWGDWNFASAFAEALRGAGHPVRLQTLDEVEDPAARSSDVQVALRGLFPMPRSPGQTHVLWVISHPEAVTTDEYDGADLVLVASPRLADHVRSLTSTPVEVFLQATDPTHFELRSPTRPRSHRVLVVANSRSVKRRVVTDADAAGIDYSVVGDGWDGIVEPRRLVADHVTYADLPRLYADADVVLNDHWDTMAHWGFVSNRVLDVLACGTPVVSDHLPELEEMFGDLVPTWRDPASLGELIADLHSEPEAWEKRALAARDVVLASHTFEHRAAELIELLDRHGLVPGGGPG